MLFELISFWVSVYSQFQLMDENNFLFIVLSSRNVCEYCIFWCAPSCWLLGKAVQNHRSWRWSIQTIQCLWPCKVLCLLNSYLIFSQVPAEGLLLLPQCAAQQPHLTTYRTILWYSPPIFHLLFLPGASNNFPVVANHFPPLLEFTFSFYYRSLPAYYFLSALIWHVMALVMNHNTLQQVMCKNRAKKQSLPQWVNC